MVFAVAVVAVVLVLVEVVLVVVMVAALLVPVLALVLMLVSTPLSGGDPLLKLFRLQALTHRLCQSQSEVYH